MGTVCCCRHRTAAVTGTATRAFRPVGSQQPAAFCWVLLHYFRVFHELIVRISSHSTSCPLLIGGREQEAGTTVAGCHLVMKYWTLLEDNVAMYRYMCFSSWYCWGGLHAAVLIKYVLDLAPAPATVASNSSSSSSFYFAPLFVPLCILRW
ncbi:unnamed protein product [Heterosigma akashiwo]